MSSKYGSIINLPHHVSDKHPRMSMIDRAAQFSPFAALTGYDAAIKETGRLTDERVELDEDTLARLNAKLNIIGDNLGSEIPVCFTYFLPDQKKEGGSYQTVTGIVKRIDEYERAVLLTDGFCIPISQIYGIESELFRGTGIEEHD